MQIKIWDDVLIFYNWVGHLLPPIYTYLTFLHDDRALGQTWETKYTQCTFDPIRISIVLPL